MASGIGLTEISGSDYISSDVINANFEAVEDAINDLQDDADALAGYTTLWSGSYFMSASQTANLSAKVSEQEHGIVLAWSAYSIDDNTTSNAEWCYFFVPKWHVAKHNGAGIWCTPVQGGTAARPIWKYVYVYDSYIVGHSRNNSTSITAAGGTWNNKRSVMRAVIGL